MPRMQRIRVGAHRRVELGDATPPVEQLQPGIEICGHHTPPGGSPKKNSGKLAYCTPADRAAFGPLARTSRATWRAWCMSAVNTVSRFTGRYEQRDVTGGIGHNLPQEAPGAFVQAVIDVDRMARS